MRFLVGVLVGLVPACVIFDTGPAYDRLRELTDEDADGSTLADGDCNDADPRVFPGAPDVCDGLDNDCDYSTDEDGGSVAWCLDGDGDGHGDPASTGYACLIPPEGVSACDDCDDADAGAHPLADERCDGRDNNCDSIVDDVDSIDAPVWYWDGDGDGYGVGDRTTRACSVPPGYAELAGDCADAEDAVNPGMLEMCNNGLDDDCDGSAGGCGFAGAADLEPHGISGVDGGYISGPAGTAEAVGYDIGVADASGDGLPDIILCGDGDMYGQQHGGSIHLWYGTPVGYQEVTGAGAHIYGPSGLYLGGDHNVLSTDLDGDGRGELVIGAVGTSVGFAPSGQVLTIEQGMSGTHEVVPADSWALGFAGDGFFGASLQRADGLVGDGEYLLVGAYGYSDVAVYVGRVYALDLEDPDRRAVSVSGDEAYDLVGLDVPPLRDLDGDGYDDVAFGVHHRNADEGEVLLLHGPLRGDYTLDDADTTISEPGSRFLGFSLTTLADADGTGNGALVISAAGASDGDYDGEIHILPGVTEGSFALSEVASATLTGEVDRGGSQLRLEPGDLNGDGTDDLLVGDPLFDRDETAGYSGAVYLITDPLSLVGTRDIAEASTARFYGRSVNDKLGASLAIGDANHDGRNDLLLSGNDVDLGWEPGGVYFLLGEGM